MDLDQLLVALNIAGNAACARMRLIAEDRVADIVVMRDLDIVKQDDIFQFRRIADNTVLADKRRTADERGVPDLGARTDDAGSCDLCGRKDLGGLVDPDIF